METRGGGTVGEKWGCALSALAVVPVLSGAYSIAWIGQCANDNQLDCIPHWLLFVGAFVVAAGVGLAARVAINAAAGRCRNDRYHP